MDGSSLPKKAVFELFKGLSFYWLKLVLVGLVKTAKVD